jgi:SAM-dependent methyltransferase
MWAIKIAAKIVLSRLPVPYRIWSWLGMFRHGQMDTARYATAVFADHMASVFPDGLPTDATVLELGVGDSLALALIARAYGAKKVYLVDVAAFARTDVEFYKAMATSLKGMGLDVPDIGAAQSLDEFLVCCNAEYLTGGIDSLRAIPARSVDLICSQAVLEHVRKNEFETTMDELRRVLKPTGKASHVVDFKDHLSGALNNLRFPATTWERNLFAKSGFYTNRIHRSSMLAMFAGSGFGNIEVRKEWKWDTLPTRRAAFAREFMQVPDADLLISGMKVTMDGSGAGTRGDASMLRPAPQ